MVRAQAMLVDDLGIDPLFAVAGGSMGGMQVLQWAASYPERVFSALPIAAAARHSAQNIAFHEVGRQAMMADPDWRGGRYFGAGTSAARARGRAHGRAHHLSVRRGIAAEIRPQLQDREEPDILVRRRLSGRKLPAPPGHHVSSSASTRTPISIITRAMDYFDLAADYDGVVANAFRGRRRVSA